MNAQQSRARRWCFTVNNPPTDALVKVKSDDRVRRGIFGEEIGESGTPHIQGYLEFFSPLRFNAVKALLPRAHLSAARGSSFDNYKYCSKDGKFETIGEWESIKKSGKKCKQNNDIQMSDLIDELATNGKSELKNCGLYIRHKISIDQRVAERRDVLCPTVWEAKYIKRKGITSFSDAGGLSTEGANECVSTSSRPAGLGAPQAPIRTQQCRRPG